MSAPQGAEPFDWQIVPTIESLYGLIPRSATTASSALDPPWEPTPPSDFGSDRMIILLVGPDEQELVAHENYLVRHSAFFQAALKQEWAEGQTHTIKLPEEKPDIVAFYLDYTYSERLPTDSTKRNNRNGKVYDVLADLYALGERLQDDKIRNVVIDEIVASADCTQRARASITLWTTPLPQSTRAPPPGPLLDACWWKCSSPRAKRNGCGTFRSRNSSVTSPRRRLPSFTTLAFESVSWWERTITSELGQA